MITQLTGRLLEKELSRAVIEVGGVGFEVIIPMSTFDRLPLEGETARLLTLLHVREDALTLYGFFTPQERKLFNLVTTTVTGIGPKLGLSILSSMPVDAFCAAVVNNDIKALSRINGVGKRSAERLVVELKDKLDDIAPAVTLTGKAPEVTLTKTAEDAVAGLISLGIPADQARKTIRQLIEELPEPDHTVQNLIRKALSSRGR